jgi:hypothetical protein
MAGSHFLCLRIIMTQTSHTPTRAACRVDNFCLLSMLNPMNSD